MFDQTPLECWEIHRLDPKALGTFIHLTENGKVFIKDHTYLMALQKATDDPKTLCLKWIAHSIRTYDQLMEESCCCNIGENKQ